MSQIHLRRLAQIRSLLTPRLRLMSSTTTAAGTLSIGDVTFDVQETPTPYKVPVGQRIDIHDQTMLRHLEWMLKKDLLGQDMFLLGPPGPMKRNLALTFCNLTNRPIEHISLHRDTSGEADIKQRREIRKVPHERVEWIDAPAVRAAINGSILIIEGIEKAERNVLPVLNNLLENREMTLEDGRHLVHPTRYETLLRTHSEADLQRWRLVKTSSQFRIIALGAPVPPFKGYPLDPPLRSRFQVRYVDGQCKSLTMQLHNGLTSSSLSTTPAVPSVKETMNSLRMIIETVQYSNRDSKVMLDLPRFPQTALTVAQQAYDLFPLEQPVSVLSKAYPHYELRLLSNEHLKSLEDLCERFSISLRPPSPKSKKITSELCVSSQSEHKCAVTMHDTHTFTQFKVIAACGSKCKTDKTIWIGSTMLIKTTSLLITSRIYHVLYKMIQTHVLNRDIMLVGPRSSGKSSLVQLFASLFGYQLIPLYCHQEMTARDLLQRRSTNTLGETIWEDSPLVTAAVRGYCCTLEGIDVLPGGVLESLNRLMCDREMALPDGSILMPDAAAQQLSLSPIELAQRGIRIVHPSFRVVVTVTMSPPRSDTSTSYSTVSNVSIPTWFSEELTTMYQPILLEGCSAKEEHAIAAAVSGCRAESLQRIVAFARGLRDEEKKSNIMTKAAAFSTRQLIRLAKRIAHHHQEDVFQAIHRMCLSSFMPTVARETLNSLLIQYGIHPKESRHDEITITPATKDSAKLIIGDEQYNILSSPSSNQLLIPRVPDFALNPLHNKLLRDMLVNFKLGDHLLLIGNQGVGKNKLTDKFLELIQRPRQYIQLHRDSTIMSLMIQSTVQNGVIVYKDSPLVSAVKNGYRVSPMYAIPDQLYSHTPVHVVSVLKSLAETGEMTLSNGVFIRPPSPDARDDEGTQDVIVHKDFRLIILANRPGFPFLGNEFFSTIGDVFSCHPIDNLDQESEMAVVIDVAPKVSVSTLKALVSSFQELRKLFDEGLVSYPFSLRELLHIARHLQRYPKDPIELVLHNVFDFDLHSSNSKELSEIIIPVLRKHGLPISDNYTLVKIAGGELGIDAKRRLELKMKPKPNAKDLDEPKHGKEDPNNDPHVGGNTWAGGTGGRDTAGLGGIGGPYRLDKGHDVHQVDDDIKNSVPEEVKRAARDMGKEALRKRLSDIHMSEYDAKNYDKFRSAVAHNIRQLQFLFNSLESKQPERVWLRNQTDGEFDESKLIESLVGEASVYKKRGLEPQETGGWRQPKPKRIKFVFDVSASMYRFNGFDGRLQRSMEAAVMIMESLAGLEHKFVYDIIGHSGDSDSIPLVVAKKPTKNEKERLQVLEKMVAHAQYCWSGDTTLEATKRSIDELIQEQQAEDNADEYHVIVLSDANLKRYGITSGVVAEVLNSGVTNDIHATMIFVGTIGEEAQRLQTSLPPGRAFVAKETRDMPNILRQVLAASIS